MTDVSTPAGEYSAMTECWRMIDSLMGGTETMRAAGARYLPKFSAETPQNWDRRRNQSRLFDAYAQTISDLTGLPFSKPVAVSDKTPDALRQFFANVDSAGTNISIFARTAFEVGLSKGAAHILVDMPPVPENGIRNREQERFRLPYWIKVDPEQVIDARAALIDGKLRYTHVRIREDVIVHEGYAEKRVERIREIAPPEWRVWEKSEKGWYVVNSGPYSLPYVTMATFMAGKRRGVFTARPPLENLAYQNIAHWQSASDQAHILSLSRFAILAFTGCTEEDVKNISIGPTSVLHLPQGADAKFVEHSGSAIAAGERDLATLKEEMAVAGSSMLVKQPGARRTATEASIDAVEEQSEMEAITEEFTGALMKASRFTAEWMKVDFGETHLDVNAEFGVTYNTQVIKEVLLALRNNRDLALEDVLAELKRIKLLSEEFDIPAAVERAREEEGVLLGMIEHGDGQ